MVNVVDTMAPVITLVGVNPQTVECGTDWDFDEPTATDVCAEASVSILSTITNTTRILIRLVPPIDALATRSGRIQGSIPVSPEVIELMRQEYGIKGGLKVQLQKNIPIKAGLGGACLELHAGEDKRLFLLGLFWIIARIRAF